MVNPLLGFGIPNWAWEREKLADEAATPDITNGMRGKLEEIKGFEPILKAGAIVVILGLSEPGILH